MRLLPAFFGAAMAVIMPAAAQETPRYPCEIGSEFPADLYGKDHTAFIDARLSRQQTLAREASAIEQEIATFKRQCSVLPERSPQARACLDRKAEVEARWVSYESRRRTHDRLIRELADIDTRNIHTRAELARLAPAAAAIEPAARKWVDLAEAERKRFRRLGWAALAELTLDGITKLKDEALELSSIELGTRLRGIELRYPPSTRGIFAERVQLNFWDIFIKDRSPVVTMRRYNDLRDRKLLGILDEIVKLNTLILTTGSAHSDELKEASQTILSLMKLLVKSPELRLLITDIELAEAGIGTFLSWHFATGRVLDFWALSDDMINSARVLGARYAADLTLARRMRELARARTQTGLCSPHSSPPARPTSMHPQP